MLTVQITEDIPIECKYLDSNIKEHCFNILKDIMNGYCGFKYGYILEIKKVISLGENKISSANSLAVFNVTYEADTLKPVVGSILKGIVCLVLQNGDGIMVDVYNKMQILIPSSNMKPFVYTKDRFELSNEKFISVGSNIDLEIVASKYEDKKYSCIGKIIY